MLVPVVAVPLPPLPPLPPAPPELVESPELQATDVAVTRRGTRNDNDFIM
jgi:hypothetical protein